MKGKVQGDGAGHPQARAVLDDHLAEQRPRSFPAPGIDHHLVLWFLCVKPGSQLANLVSAFAITSRLGELKARRPR
jgi:hypothetical protein